MRMRRVGRVEATRAPLKFSGQQTSSLLHQHPRELAANTITTGQVHHRGTVSPASHTLDFISHHPPTLSTRLTMALKLKLKMAALVALICLTFTFTFAQQTTLTVPFYTSDSIEPTYAASVINVQNNATTILLECADAETCVGPASTVVFGTSTFALHVSDATNTAFTKTQHCITAAENVLCQELLDFGTGLPQELHTVNTYPASGVQRVEVPVTSGAEKFTETQAAATAVSASTTAQTAENTPSFAPKTLVAKSATSPSRTQIENKAVSTPQITLTLPFYAATTIFASYEASIKAVKHDTTTLVITVDQYGPETLIIGSDIYSAHATTSALSSTQNCVTTKGYVECDVQVVAADITWIQGTATYGHNEIQTKLVAVTAGAQKLNSSAGGAASDGLGRKIAGVVAVGGMAWLWV